MTFLMAPIGQGVEEKFSDQHLVLSTGIANG
jgi:hypothetical protein